MMGKINTKKLIYHLKYRYLSLNNVALAVALVIGLNWAWGSIEMMQRNYRLQKTLELKRRQQILTELEVATLNFEKRYYESDEYKDLAAREHLGLAAAGEKVLILPPNSEEASAQGKKDTRTKVKPTSNFQQWTNFLFGGNRRNLQK